MKVLFDYGNSFLAWAVRDGSQWRTGKINGREVDSLAGRLSECFDAWPVPQQVWVSSVANQSSLDILSQWIVEHWLIEPRIVQPSATAGGVSGIYTEPETLGSDRWAALVAVNNRYRLPACIVDCGTAVTIDLLDADNRFRGGVIFPGLGLLRESLLQNTELPQPEVGDDSQCLAKSTADGILTGTLLGLIAAIEKIVDCQSREMASPPTVYLTGGDAHALSSRLIIKHKLVDDLVLQGIEVISELES